MINLFKTQVKSSSRIHPGHKPKSLLEQTKHYVRGLAFTLETNGWFKILQRPELAMVAGNHPYLFQRFQRPYRNRILSSNQRLQALKQHYQFVVAQFSPMVQHEIYATPGKLLATLPKTGVGTFGLRLSCSRQEKEGDLVIGLVNLDTEATLFTLAFSVTRWETTSKEIFIGGLQGNKLANDKELIIDFTRGLHGLRPKALLIFALQALADTWGVTRLRAVSDETNIYWHWQKRNHVSTSYDKWWIECGGQRGVDGMFELPVKFTPRDISTLKVNKRHMYKRRYLLLAEIAEQIRGSGPIRSQDHRLARMVPYNPEWS